MSREPAADQAGGTPPAGGARAKSTATSVGVTPAAAHGGGAEDRRLTPGERVFYQFARAVMKAFAQVFWRVRVEGRAHVPVDGPFVVAPVHRSNIDTILMAFVTRRQLRYMAKDSLWKHGWSARLLTALGGFPVNRDAADREALRTCEAALGRGEPVVIFPEGTRKAGPVITDLFQGAAFVALRAGVPIVPVGIGGSAGAMPKGSKFLHPVKIRILIGPPIQPPPRPGAGARGSRRHVHELTAQLQEELQQLFDQAEGR
ncbi:MAG: 1-acyl-sn-glycerol-3-phosphate acyltransferase [Actinomycetota bacterium]|nr:1-acyl-sn-glycerol-3-phosphate acyltransferase [Actinomycetota bacterium]